MSRNASHTVFVGNIPYDVTEQELTEIFSEVGPIKSMRMVSDKDTGKPKGYAFCEYFDRGTAESAVRNLNQHEVSGRNLRVDYAEDHPGGGGGGGGGGPRGDRFFDRDGPRAGGGRFDRDRDGPRGPYGPPAGLRPLGAGSAASAAQAMASMLNSPQLASGPAQETLNNLLGSMNPVQLFEVMAQMKTLAQQNPAAARQLLVSQPQLTRGMFQAQILLGMVKPQARPAQTQGQQGMAPGPAGPLGAPQQGPPQQFAQGQPQPAFLPPQQPAAAMLPAGQPQVVVLGPGGVILDQSVLQQPHQQPLPVQAPVAILPPQQPIPQQPMPQQPIQQQPIPQQPLMPIAQPAPQAPAPQPAAPAPLSQDQQQALLNQLLRLTPEQLEALPPVEKAQALAIINMIKQQQGGQ